MKTLLFFSILLTSSIIWCSPNQIDKNKPRNKKGQKHGHWIVFGKDQPKKGFPSDGKIEEGNYVEGRKQGKWTHYHKDGKTPQLIGNYINNRPEGAYEKIDEKGNVYERGNFKQGKYQDSLVRFHPNGIVKYSAFFNQNGEENGTVTHRYDNNQVEFQYESVNGIPSGKANRYYKNGDVKEIIQYSADGSVLTSEKKEMVNPAVKTRQQSSTKQLAPKVVNPKTKNGTPFQPNGYNKIYNSNDEIWQDGDFKNGRLWDGKIYEYDSDGILLKVKVFKEGSYHSEGQL